MIYCEVQRFSPKALGAIWIMVLLLALALELLGPDRDASPVFVLPAMMLLVFVLFFLGCTLRTEVRDGVLTVRLWPLPRLRVMTEDIETVEAVEYRPLRDFGGWGWRIGSKGTAYSTSGNRAVRIEVKSKRPIFIGSARPHELAAALQTSIARKGAANG